jgi:Leucyl aminopeptidase
MINFNSKFNSKASNIGFFISNDLKFKPSTSIPQSTISKINSFLKKKSKDNKKQIFSFDLSESQKCFLILIKKNLNIYEINNLGASLKNYIKTDKTIKNICILGNSFSEEIISEFAYGFELKSYTFNKYKSKKDDFVQSIDFSVKNPTSIKLKYKNFSSIKEGVFLARDLVSEPPNVLNPKNYTEEIKKLKKLGLKVEVLNEKQMKKLGMHSLLGVGQGSENESFMVVIKWNGAKQNFGKPLAL